jgi:hypothetical protein
LSYICYTMLRGAKILLFILVMSVSRKASAQLLTNLGEYRNQIFLSSGYYLSFANYSVGWIHNEHIKFLKRDVAGILDFSFPFSDTSHTKFVFRKGFQTNIWANETFRLPVALIGSSDKVVTHLTRIHNFVTDLFFNPGIYKKFYTVALELDWFSIRVKLQTLYLFIERWLSGKSRLNRTGIRFLRGISGRIQLQF